MVRTVGVRELKNELSAWLREVKAGARVLVTERGTVVAEIRPPPAHDLGRAPPAALDDWARDRRIVPPHAPHGPLPASPVSSAPATAQRLLDAERDEP